MLRITPGVLVIRSHLADLMLKNRLKTAELARMAEVNRSTVAALAKDRATRVELAAVERICTVLGCGIADLLEIVPDNSSPAADWKSDRCL